jgi:hypothetical protein
MGIHRPIRNALAALTAISAALLVTVIMAPRLGRQRSALHAALLRWNGPFGASNRDPHTIYCLMGQGYFRAETSTDFDSLVHHWIKIHPRAVVTTVCRFGPASRYDPRSQIAWVWVADDTANLNEYLVSQGGCSWMTMQMGSSITPTRTESFWETGLLVSLQSYQKFLIRVAAAEQQAKRQGAGIWDSQ